MAARILIVQGHPDYRRPHLCHALARAYEDGARAAGHEVEVVEPARMDFPLLSSPAEWRHGSPPPQLAAVQDAIRGADHLVFLYPLWLGGMPAVLKGFLEQVVRPGFGVAADDRGQAVSSLPGPGQRRSGLQGSGLLCGRSARVVVSTPMAGLLYRWVDGAHSLKMMRRHVLGPAGIHPVRSTVVGGDAGMAPEQLARWEERLRRLGERAA
jgi:putative NADPH-quinone reductase